MTIAIESSSIAVGKSPVPTGLGIVTILLTAHVLVELGLMAYFLSSIPIPWPDPRYVLIRYLPPFVLTVLTAVMIVLIFARRPAAKPFGITACSLNYAFQLYTDYRLYDFYEMGGKRFTDYSLISRFAEVPIYLSSSPYATGAANAVKAIHITLFTLALIFLAKWQPGRAPATSPAAADHSPRASYAPHSPQGSHVAHSPRGSYFARHWRGGVSLGKSYWINGVLIGLLWLVFWFAAVAALAASVRSRDVLVLSLCVLIVLQVSLYLWQTVGIWRSARKHVARGGKRFWAVLVQILIVPGLLFAALTLIQNISVTAQIASNPNAWLDPMARRR